MNTFRFILTAGLVFIPNLTFGQNLGAHVHGVATLNVAIEDNRVDIELHSPAANIVGFERKASTAQEIKSVKNAKLLLESASVLFSFPSVECKVVATSVNLGDLIENSDHGKSPHTDSDHREHNDDHSHDHDHYHREEHQAHTEIVASYRYECGKLQALESISVQLFKVFPKLEKIDVQWLTSKQQGSQAITPTNPTFLVK